MPWITLTTDDLKARLSDTELTKVGNAKLAPGQTAEGVLAEVLAGVVSLIRGHAAKSGTIGPAGTVPDEIKDAAMAILRFRVFTRLPNLGLLGEDRRKEYDDAVRLLSALAKGDFLVDRPSEPSAENFATETIDFTSGGRQASRTQLSGL